MPAARLAESWRMRPSPPEHGRPPVLSAVIAASHAMAANGVPSLMPWSMNFPVKSSRCRNVPLADEEFGGGFEREQAGCAVAEGCREVVSAHGDLRR